jgi:hypothetical protein
MLGVAALIACAFACSPAVAGAATGVEHLHFQAGPYP